MLQLYEKNGIEADEDLIVQYLQNRKTAKEFAVYLDLFNKYKEEYPVDAILEGEIPDEMAERASGAGFDEVYTLIGLMLSNVKDDVHERMEERRLFESVKLCIKEYWSPHHRPQCAGHPGYNRPGLYNQPWTA